MFTAIPQKPGKSLLLGFATVFILYFVIALKIDLANEHLLSKKVADIFMLKNNYWLLIIISSFIGGLIAGLSALTGSLLRKAFKKERRAY